MRQFLDLGLRVKQGSLAEEAGIKLGDSILKINGVDTAKMSLGQAQKSINDAEGQLRLTTAKFDENDDGGKPQSVKEIVLGGKNANLRNKSINIFDRVLQPPRLAVHVHKAERKVWHPVVWQQSTSPSETPVHIGYGEDAPHKRIIRNIRRLLAETEDDLVARNKHIENMLLALPTGAGHLEEQKNAEDKTNANGNGNDAAGGGDAANPDDDFDWFADDADIPIPEPEPPKPKASKKKTKKKSQKGADDEDESD